MHGLLQLAVQGSSMAQLFLGDMYFRGEGCSQDYKKAAYWYLRSATGGNADAQLSIGLMYSTGAGVEKSPIESCRYLKMAAMQGNPIAQYNLAKLYLEGTLPQGREYNEAFHWMHSSALLGNDCARYSLGIMYANGIGTERSLDESLKWLRLASQQGNDDAIDVLCLLCMRSGNNVT